MSSGTLVPDREKVGREDREQLHCLGGFPRLGGLAHEDSRWFAYHGAEDRWSAYDHAVTG